MSIEAADFPKNMGSATPHGPDDAGDETLEDNFTAMLAAVQAFHDKHDFKSKGGEELVYRVALMSEELGEISAAVTKGKPKSDLAEECADLLILLLGTAISADLDLGDAFWSKMSKLLQREGRMINGRIRVSDFQKSGQRRATLSKATVVDAVSDWAKATMEIDAPPLDDTGVPDAVGDGDGTPPSL